MGGEVAQFVEVDSGAEERGAAWGGWLVGKSDKRLDGVERLDEIRGMTATAILELKQRVSILPESDRRSLAAYMLRLKHETAAAKRGISQTMRDMDAGRKTRLRDLAMQLGHSS